MAELLHAVTLWKRLVGVTLRSQMTYRLSFLFDFFGVFLVTLMEFGAFALVLPRFGGIGGWGLGEVALLYGTVNAAFGFMDMFFSGFDPRNFGQQVRLGRLDQLLLRPANITLQVLGSEFELRRVGRITIGLAILALSFSLTDIHWTLARIAVLLFAIFGQVAFFGGLFIIGATITFWTIESIEAINIFTYGGTELISYPMHIYPSWLRRFFTFILPGIFLNYYPALTILDKADPLGMPAVASWLAPFAGGLVLFMALRFWRFGIGRYQSTGT